MDFLKLSSDKLDPTAISELVAHESCGAVAMFAGTTRDNFDGKEVVSLEYEAYDEMAKKEMAAICFEVRQRWPDVMNIAMYHRLGFVPVKEASVVIAISSPHRASSLQALPFALDELKKLVPIWKKEYYKENAEDQKINVGKKLQLNFDDCQVVEDQVVPMTLVQITTADEEVQRRIDSFIERKRDEINKNNLRDFIDGGIKEDSCARVLSKAYKVEDSKGHLKVKKVLNETGPADLTTDQERACCSRENDYIGIEERLKNIEAFVGFDPRPIPKDIYKRLKAIEDEVRHLKTISPEYFHFKNDSTSRKKIVYTLEDLDDIINGMESAP